MLLALAILLNYFAGLELEGTLAPDDGPEWKDYL